MKKDSEKSKSNSIFIYFLFIWQWSNTSSLYSGSWCPYKVEKMIPCRTRNGTEPYYGPSICWKSINGSHSCTKKILYRPKFITTFKKIYETSYKCCPGLEGMDCLNECFNCSTYHDIISRVNKLESNLHHLVAKNKDSHDDDEDVYGSQNFVDEDVFHENLVNIGDTNAGGEGGEKSLTFIALKTRITSLLNEFKDMDSRIRSLESEVRRLSSSLEETTRTHHQHHHPIHQHHNNQILKEKLQSSGIEALSPPYRGDLSHYSDVTTNYQQFFSSKTSNPPLPPPSKSQVTTEISTRKTSKEIHEVKSVVVKRLLEDNLERGDIASTLNDDYGEEILFENSTEQYVDDPYLVKDLRG